MKPSLLPPRASSTGTTTHALHHASTRLHHPLTHPSPPLARAKTPPHTTHRARSSRPGERPHPSTIHSFHARVPVTLFRTHRHRWPATRRTRRPRSSPPRARDSSARSPPRSTSRVVVCGRAACEWARPVRDSIVWANSVTVTSRMRFTIRDSRARHTATPRRRHRMAESQWEHQAKFAGELFLGVSALVGAYLCFMCAHLRGERRARLARRAAAAARGGEAGTRDERARLVGGGAERGGGVV